MTVPDAIETINETLRGVADWLARQRWFGEKTRPIIAVEPETVWFFTLEDVDWALSSVVVQYGDADASRYFLPVAIDAGDSGAAEGAVIAVLADGRRIVDALHVPSVQRWWVQQMATGRIASGSGESWRWSHVGDNVAVLQRAAVAPARVLAGEQSNTSLLFGQDLIFKVFRRLEPGENPDVEIGAYLTKHFQTVPVPKLYGDVTRSHDGQSYTVAAAQQFVPNMGDCWQWLLHILTDGTKTDIEEASQAMSLLGTRTGELHMALGAATADAAFQPAPIDSAFCANMRSTLAYEIDLTVHLLHQADRLPAGSDLADRLSLRLSGVDVLRGSDAIRVHGDYHLGQVLRTVQGDFSIIDFEGEPSRPIEDRRRRYPALKDVAGMTRSLDYARAAVGRLTTPPGDVERRDEWFINARDAFLDAYRAATRAAHGRLIPESEGEFRAALALFELEKALYETRYELNNRPDWVDIPFGAIRDIAAHGA